MMQFVSCPILPPSKPRPFGPSDPLPTLIKVPSSGRTSRLSLPRVPHRLTFSSEISGSWRRAMAAFVTWIQVEQSGH